MWKNLVILLLALGWLTHVLVWKSRSNMGVSRSVNIAPPPGPSLSDATNSYDKIHAFLDQMGAEPELKAASLGFCLLGDSLDPVVDRRAGEAMTPASVLKTLTSATALEMLGPEFTFSTVVGGTGPISEEGVLDGDLIIVGGGDPLLRSEHLAAWAADLEKQGLKRVLGRVIADSRHFPDDLAADFWDWGDVSNYYGAGPSGLNLDLNHFSLTHRSGDAVDEPAPLTDTEPALPWLTISNQVRTVSPEGVTWTSIYGGPYAETLTVRGTVPLDQEDVRTYGAIPDPPLHAALTLTETLKKSGIEIEGEAATSRALALAGNAVPSPEKIFLRHRSPSLLEIVRHLLHVSDNMVTECLFLTLARQENFSRPSADILRRHWEARGVKLEGLRMEDGSGLARANFIRPLDLARVLFQARRGPHGEAFVNALNPFADGRIRWKHGYMSRVHATAGYVRAYSGSEYTFVLILNNPDSGFAMHPWRRRLVDTLLELPEFRPTGPERHDHGHLSDGSRAPHDGR